MAEINLLDLYPRITRNLEQRADASEEDRLIARQFGKEYFDGTRNQGYGGYNYDGRWRPIVKRFQEHYDLTASSSLVDVGCGKGFMLHDFMTAIPGMKVAGVDISPYAIANAMESTRPFLTVGNAMELPFPDKSFDLLISINVIHNLKGEDLVRSIREMERVSRRYKFMIVDAYESEEEKQRFMKWNLTAQTILHRQEWKDLLAKAGYTGDYYWFSP